MRRRIHPARDSLKSEGTGIEALAVLVHGEIFGDVAMLVAGAVRALGRRASVRRMGEGSATRHPFGVGARGSCKYRVDLQWRELLVLPRLVRDFDDVLFDLRQVRHKSSHYPITSR